MNAEVELSKVLGQEITEIHFSFSFVMNAKVNLGARNHLNVFQFQLCNECLSILQPHPPTPISYLVTFPVVGLVGWVGPACTETLLAHHSGDPTRAETLLAQHTQPRHPHHPTSSYSRALSSISISELEQHQPFKATVSDNNIYNLRLDG